MQRYSLYVVLVVLGVSVAGNNLFARTIRPDEVGQGAIWTSFQSSDTPDLIVETAPAKKLTSAPQLAIGGLPTAALALTPTENTTSTAVGQDHIGDTDDGSDPLVRDETTSYTVVNGDTISTIADRFGISIRTVLWANGLSETDYIKPGQSLKIPPLSGYLYTIKKGDTLAAIAKKYKGDVEEILTANDLPAADAIEVGQEIIIPGGEPPAAVPTVTPRRTLLGGIFSPPSTTVVPPSGPLGRGKFAWPTSSHRINQYYRGRYHTGVDIDGDYSSPIYAAASGTVVYAAYNRSGYGLHVIIDHGNGYKTLYGHASKIFVHNGQRVTKGQTIAMVGSTGRSTGTHLHFEIRTSGGFLNPLSFY